MPLEEEERDRLLKHFTDKSVPEKQAEKFDSLDQGERGSKKWKWKIQVCTFKRRWNYWEWRDSGSVIACRLWPRSEGTIFRRLNVWLIRLAVYHLLHCTLCQHCGKWLHWERCLHYWKWSETHLSPRSVFRFSVRNSCFRIHSHILLFVGESRQKASVYWSLRSIGKAIFTRHWSTDPQENDKNSVVFPQNRIQDMLFRLRVFGGYVWFLKPILKIQKNIRLSLVRPWNPSCWFSGSPSNMGENIQLPWSNRPGEK